MLVYQFFTRQKSKIPETKLAKNDQRKRMWDFPYIFEKKEKKSQELDLNPGPIAYNAITIPLDHEAIYRLRDRKFINELQDKARISYSYPVFAIFTLPATS